MFDEEQVCRDLLILCSLKDASERANILGKVIREIRKEPIVKQGYSSAEISTSVKHIAGMAHHEEADERADYIKRAVARLNREFRNSLGTWNFVISIENLKLGPRLFRVGDVTFFEFTPNRRKEMRSKIWRLIKDNPHYTTEWKKDFVKTEDEKVLSLIKDKTCALVQVMGRLEKAQLIAYDKVETAIATLKLYRFANYDRQMQYFHLTGRVVPSTIRLTLRYTDDERNINPMMERVGLLFPFELSDDRIRFMRATGFSKIHGMLKKENPHDLEKKIINSIRLFGIACDVVVTKTSTRRPIGLGFPSEKELKPKTIFEAIFMNERLIRLFIALESLLIFDENEPLATNIGERCAFLLGKTYDERKNIKTYVKEMYDLRSAYVHHGISKIDHATLGHFTRFVQDILLTMVMIKDRMKLTTEQSLKEWFERKKLS